MCLQSSKQNTQKYTFLVNISIMDYNIFFCFTTMKMVEESEKFSLETMMEGW